MHVLSDSTIDHNDQNVRRACRRASRDIVRRFARAGVRASVDAVCGSGFVARASYGEHFASRLRALRRGGFDAALLVVGGWNDATSGHSEARVVRAVARCLEHF